MSGHRHHHGHDKKACAVVQDNALETDLPHGDNVPGVSSPAMPLVEPSVPTGFALPVTALPSEVYLIGCGVDLAVQGQASAQSMGFKAWNLLRMAQLALPVPAAFVIGTRYCVEPGARGDVSGANLWRAGLHALERATGQALGNARRPLLLSVRSGAPVSMPGMMETLLNIGLCDATVAGLMRQTGNPRLVWDAYRRLVASYGEVVAGLAATRFDEAASALFPARDEREFDFADLRLLTQRFLEVYAMGVGKPFPQDSTEQLGGAIEAVSASWQSPKAREYRQLNHIADAIGTAVTVQCMVFGNAGGQSGAGVGFTRDPASGEPALWVDFLFNEELPRLKSGTRKSSSHVWTRSGSASRRPEPGRVDTRMSH